MTVEYLNRPLIEGVSYEISETRIAIQCSHTCFLTCVISPRCQKEDMLSRYRQILQTAKAQGCKISYSRHIRRTILAQWPDYVAGREKQERLFQELREVASIIQRRGIHTGYIDDEELKKANEIVGEFNRLRLGNKAVRNIAGFDYELYMLERQLSDGHRRYNMIAL